MAAPGQLHGTVTRLVRDRGFGFIKAGAGAGTEYFFHRSSVMEGSFEDLRERDAVDFEIEPSSKGPRATNVRRA